METESSKAAESPTGERGRRQRIRVGNRLSGLRRYPLSLAVGGMVMIAVGVLTLSAISAKSHRVGGDVAQHVVQRSTDTAAVRRALSAIPTLEDVRAALGPDARFYGSYDMQGMFIGEPTSDGCAPAVGDLAFAWGGGNSTPAAERAVEQRLASRSDVYKVKDQDNAFVMMDVYVFATPEVAKARMEAAGRLADRCLAGSLKNIGATTHHPSRVEDLRVDYVAGRGDGIRSWYSLMGDNGPVLGCFVQAQAVSTSILMVSTCGDRPAETTSDLMARSTERTFAAV